MSESSIGYSGPLLHPKMVGVGQQAENTAILVVPLTPEERAAKAACIAFAESRQSHVGAEAEEYWNGQTAEYRAHWIAAIRTAVAEEREACAREVEAHLCPQPHDRVDQILDSVLRPAVEHISAAIRARSTDAPQE